VKRREEKRREEKRREKRMIVDPDPKILERGNRTRKRKVIKRN